MNYEPSEESFLKDVSTHEMQIIRNDGVHRHIRFKRPDTINMYFDLITWPGYLCYTGDMGTYVFRRIEDMFEFFRSDREYANSHGRKIGINPGYWSEKVQAADKHGGIEEFDEDRFRRVVNGYRIEWVREMIESGTSKDDRREMWESVESDVLDYACDGEASAFSAANSFSHRVGEFNFSFEDFWDHRFTKYTYRFIWCCYALAWGVEQFDNASTTEQVKP